MKGFESDNFVSFLNSDKVNWNYNDGSCQTTCSNGSCYGNYQVPTSGRYTTIDIGSLATIQCHIKAQIGQLTMMQLMKALHAP